MFPFLYPPEMLICGSHFVTNRLIVINSYGKYMGKQWKQWETLFSWAPKSLQVVTAAMKLKDACSLEERL